MCLRKLGLLCCIVFFFSVANVRAHQGEDHSGVEVTVSDSAADDAFPFEVGGPFSLTDHRGSRVTDKDFHGKHMLVLFGYVNCKIMCSTTLNRMSAALDALGDRVDEVAPLIITVDPSRDTPESMKEGLSKYHRALMGLTGTEAELQQAYDAYNIMPEVVGEDWEKKPIISHSSYLYLMGPDGQFQTLLPPIVEPSIMAQIMLKYIDADT